MRSSHTFVTPNTRIRYSPPVILQPPQEFVIPKRVMKGITNIPCLHIGSRTGSEGSKTANSYRAIEPAQPATKAVCII
uniref:Uncharacterized protein n=1 Tax=Helianthus annuus TaxID=4232 RepID=A0A251UVW0_HELAN